MDGYITVTGLLSIASCLIGFYFSSRTAHRQDQAAETEKIQREQRMWDKLEEISGSTKESRQKLNEISAEISNLKQDGAESSSKVRALDLRVKAAEQDIAAIQQNLAKLHAEHRKRCETCGK